MSCTTVTHISEGDPLGEDLGSVLGLSLRMELVVGLGWELGVLLPLVDGIEEGNSLGTLPGNELCVILG
jgi:hypothetical protein